MKARGISAGQANRDEADLQELRAETLNLILPVILVLVFTIMTAAVADPATRQPEMLVIVLLLLATAAATRLQRFGLVVAAALVVAGLALSTLATSLVYAHSQFVYSFSLLVIVASMLLGDLPAFGIAAVSSAAVLALAQRADHVVPTGATGTVLFLIWSAAILSCLAARPTRTALDWAWRSYLQALQRTEELRDRQGELGRLAKSLDEACARLAQMNGELERARTAAEEARRLKAEFAATISHELRTPLNLIIGFSEMMMNAPRSYAGQPLAGSYRQDLEAIYRNACHISSLVDDVLDLSQIEAHRMALERSKASLSRIVEEAVATVASLFEHLGLTLTIDVPADLPLVYVDANRVRQILINLLNNAARFTDRGGVTIRATCDGRDVVLAVADTGAGVAPEDLPHVFQEFHQAGPLGRRTGGSGLGLAVCKRFAEMHGGCMWAESRLGQGSTFYLALPLCENVVTTPVEQEPVRLPVGGRTVVVLGRGPETAKVFQRYLDGYQVVRAPTVDELRQLAAEDRPLHALVVTDSEACTDWRKLQIADPRLRGLPVFTCSLSTSRFLAKELSIDEYLTKPISRERLAGVLRRVASGARDVLIVEDDPEMMRLLNGMVRTVSRRYRIRQASDGAEALALLRESRPDVLLLDLLLPQVSGYEVLRQMRADAALRDVPVVVISAKGAREETVRISALGLSRADGLTVGELMRCLRSSLDTMLDVAHPDSAPTQPAGFAA